MSQSLSAKKTDTVNWVNSSELLLEPFIIYLQSCRVHCLRLGFWINNHIQANNVSGCFRCLRIRKRHSQTRFTSGLPRQDLFKNAPCYYESVTNNFSLSLPNVPENLGSRLGYTVMPLKSEGNFCITPIFVGRACGTLRGMSCFIDQLWHSWKTMLTSCLFQNTLEFIATK